MILRLTACIVLCLCGLILSGCCSCFDPDYSADCVESRLISSEVYENYPSDYWAAKNHELRSEYSAWGVY